jgi:hypothetical protein
MDHKFRATLPSQSTADHARFSLGGIVTELSICTLFPDDPITLSNRDNVDVSIFRHVDYPGREHTAFVLALALAQGATMGAGL